MIDLCMDKYDPQESIAANSCGNSGYGYFFNLDPLAASATSGASRLALIKTKLSYI